MQKLWWILSLFLLSCANPRYPSNSLESSIIRAPSGDQKTCRLIKHPQEPLYKVLKDGEPISEFWYDEGWAKKVLQNCLE